jgi:multiple sugar transport system substrate-binding protein
MIQAHRIPDPAIGSAVSRRRFIQAALGAAGSVAVLSACGGAATTPPAATAAQANAAPVVSTVAETVVVTSAQVKTVTVAVTQTVTASAAAPAAAPGKVRFSYTPGVAFDKVYQGLASQFQQQHSGTQVTAEGTWDWDNNKFIVQAAGGNAADVVWSDETYDTQLFTAGVTSALDSYLATDAQYKTSDYFESPMAGYRYQGKQIGLAMLCGPYVLWYNKALFDQAGQKYPTPSWTWDDFLTAATALTKPSSDPSTFGQYGFETRNHQNVWVPWIFGEGGQIFSDDGTKSLMDSPEAIAGIQYWLDLVYKHKVAPTPKMLSANKLGTNAFGMTGKVGMVYNGIYFWNGYKKNQSLDFDITFIPHGPKSNSTNLPTDGLVMWKGTRAPDLAWEFMKFLVSQPAEEQYVTGGVDGMPVNKAAAQLILKQPGPPANKQAFYDVFQYAKPTFTDPYGQEAIGVLQDQGKFGDMWNNDLNVHDTLTAAVPLMNKSIAEQIANQKKNQ